MSNVRTEEVTLKVDGQDMPTFVAYPEASGPRTPTANQQPHWTHNRAMLV